MIRCMKGLQYILTNSIQLNPFKWNEFYHITDPSQEQLRGGHIYRILNQLTSVEGHPSHIPTPIPQPHQTKSNEAYTIHAIIRRTNTE